MTTALALERIRLGMSGRIEIASSLARQLGKPTLFSRVEPLPAAPDPLAFLAASSAALGAGMLWEQPSAELAFAGAGVALEVRATGSGRFGQVSKEIRDLHTRLIRDDDKRFPSIGGFAFSERTEDSARWADFPDARLLVPQVLIQNDGDTSLLRVTLQVEPSASPGGIEEQMRYLFELARGWISDYSMPIAEPSGFRAWSVPQRGAWESSVATAIAMIRQGNLDKVVLAREERLLTDRPFSALTSLAKLRRLDSTTTLFAMQSGGSWFIGATPERLVRLAHDRVDVSCLAGSTDIGQGLAEQRHLANHLLTSRKDREEHEIVVRSTMNALGDICENVTRLPGTPRVVAARSVQHLETPLTARMPEAGNVLDLVERLHPTPAVGGHPQDHALSIIRELEEIDRGWYAGPFGWTDLDGSGEFAVAIRSALVSGRTASVFAGCGIVADSVPGDEYEETCLKLRPMLSALIGT